MVRRVKFSKKSRFFSCLPGIRRFGTQDGDIWLNYDCCGLFCAGLTWFLLFYGCYATNKYVIIPWLYPSPWCALHMFLFTSFIILGLVSHAKCMCTNPGAVPEDAIPVDRGETKPRVCRR